MDERQHELFGDVHINGSTYEARFQLRRCAVTYDRDTDVHTNTFRSTAPTLLTKTLLVHLFLNRGA
jgi:hypothetical protein